MSSLGGEYYTEMARTYEELSMTSAVGPLPFIAPRPDFSSTNTIFSGDPLDLGPEAVIPFYTVPIPEAFDQALWTALAPAVLAAGEIVRLQGHTCRETDMSHVYNRRNPWSINGDRLRKAFKPEEGLVYPAAFEDFQLQALHPDDEIGTKWHPREKLLPASKNLAVVPFTKNLLLLRATLGSRTVEWGLGICARTSKPTASSESIGFHQLQTHISGKVIQLR
jgi:hypothetical protein